MQYDNENIFPILNKDIFKTSIQESLSALETVLGRSGAGNDFLGWLDIPVNKDFTIEGYDLEELQAVAREIADEGATLVCIGIGGSYLGHKMAIEALTPGQNRILFAGNDISADHLGMILDTVHNRDNVYLNPISKSGTTTEPGIAFRVLRQWLESRYGEEEAVKRIIATTDKSKGALRKLADDRGYRTFVIPDSVGGRFSVLTPVGLFPIGAAGIDIREILQGARDMAQSCTVQDTTNPAVRYAATRCALYNEGKSVEILSTFEPRLRYFAEWWKQLAGESEGKDRTGLFPASTVFSTDLHSLGQWIQDGPRNILETFLIVDKSARQIQIEESDENDDNLNYLAGKSFDEINRRAYEGTAQAHTDGSVPNSTVRIEELTPYHLGQLIFFFEMTIAISGYQLGVNPFNQPGVEKYKTNMFRLLGKPGVD